MLIAGFNKTTLLDYPGRIAAAVFVGGCNFRCPFCHNAGLVLNPLCQEAWTEAEILSFLRKRKNVLKAVCISGGEPTIHADLPEFIKEIRALGYQVKLDTNGYLPNVLRSLLKENLLDYVAMDIKNCPDKYAASAGMYEDRTWPVKEGGAQGEFHVDRIKESAALLMEAGIAYEFRTTVVRELHTKEDLMKIAEWIRGCSRYFLQQYRDSGNVICSVLNGTRTRGNITDHEPLHGYSREEMEDMAEAIRQMPGMTGEVSLRGAD